MKTFLTILMTMAIGVSLSQTPQDLQQSLQSKIQKAYKKKKFAGLSIAVFNSDSIIWAQGKGFADKSAGTPAGPTTIYPIGSVSKVLTATAIMKMVDQGLVELDKPFTYYVPEFSMKKHFEGEPFTVRDLLTHYAGIPRVRIKGLYSDNPAPIYGLIEEGKDDYLIAPPKTVYQYSDWGVTLLGCLIEKISGSDFRAYMEKEVFLPLGMTNSTFYPYSTIDQLTKGYDNDLEETKVFMNRTLPADGAKTSVLDMARFMQLFINDGKVEGHDFLSTDIIKQMTTIQDAEYPLGIGYRGLGWVIEDYYGHKTVAHYGDMYPCISGSIYLPELGVGVVLFSNTYKAIGSAKRILDTAVDELIKLYGAEKKIPEKKKLNLKSVKEGGDRYIGSFATPVGVIEITKKNNRKHRVKFWQEGHTLSGVLNDDNTLILRKLGFKILTLDLREINGQETLFYHENGLMKLAGKRIVKPPLNERWRQLVGSYKVSDLAGGYEFLTSFHIYEKNGLLIGEGTTVYPTVPEFQIVLQPLDEQLALIQGVGGEGLLGETIPINITENEVSLRLVGYDMIRQ